MSGSRGPLSSVLEGLREVCGGVMADLRGGILEALEATDAKGAAPQEVESRAAEAASIISELAAAGITAGVDRLETLVVKGARLATVTAVRSDTFLLVTMDPSGETARVEKALRAWMNDASGGASTPAETPPTDEVLPTAPAAPVPVPALPVAAPAAPAERTPAPVAHDRLGADPWAALRSALARGQVARVPLLQREIEDAAPSPGRPGSEPLAAPECASAIQVLVEGIEAVSAGEGLRAGSILRELAGPSQQNLSIRWLASLWSVRAALKSDSVKSARSQVKEAVTIARQLDIDARAVSQWSAAEVLAEGGEHARAFAWLAEARGRFERLADGWGLARTWLAEARILTGLHREQEALEAARKARAADPEWAEPAAFLARRDPGRDGPLAGARPATTPVVTDERVGQGIEAVRSQPAIPGAPSGPASSEDSPSSARPLAATEEVVSLLEEAGAAGKAVFSGQLSVFALPDLLEFFRSARRTGLLVFNSAAGTGMLRFRNGCIARAGSPRTPLLGQLLLRAGKISEAALEAVVASQAHHPPGRLIGQLLAREGLVDAPAVQEALRQQIEHTVRELVLWKDGQFTFSPESAGETLTEEISVEIDAQAVLLGVFKEMDETSRGPVAEVEF